MKKPTPETDAVAAYEGNWDTKALRMTAHSRKLERERDEARRECKFLWDERDEARAELTNLESLMFGGLVQPATKNALAWRVFDAVMAMKKERDEANSELNEKYIEYDQLFEEAEKIRIERDEAQAEIQRLRLDAQLEAEHHDRMVGELERVYKERDEATDMVEKLTEIGLELMDSNKLLKNKIKKIKNT